MTKHLPVHPRTGLTALGVVKGRAVWPILGGDENAGTAVVEALTEVEAQLATNRSAILEFADKGADLTDEESTRFAELGTERETLTAKAEKLAARAKLIQAAGSETSRDLGAFRTGAPDLHVKRSVKDPFKDLTSRNIMSLGDNDASFRARSFIETSEAETLTDSQRSFIDAGLATDRSGKFAKHLLGAGSDAYTSAFEKMAMTEGKGGHTFTDAERAAWELAASTKRGILESSDSAGGTLVPPLYDPTVLNFTEYTVSPIRNLVDSRSISGPKLTQPTIGSISVGYLGEAVEVNESVPTTGELTWEAHKMGGYVKSSYEALEDTGISSILTGLLAIAKDQFELAEFLKGDGQAGHILGIVPMLVAANRVVKTATTGQFDVADLYTLRAGVPQTYRANFSYLGTDDTLLAMRRFANGDPNMANFIAPITADQVDRILGKPYYEVSNMDNPAAGFAFSSGQNVLVGGDLRQAYRIVDRRGMTVEFDALVKGANQRPTGERGWFLTWRTGGGALNPRAARVLQIK